VSSVPVDPFLVEQIQERAEAVRARVAACTDREVRIVCVTKAHPVEVAAAAFAAGFDDLGENYAQELQAKAVALDGSAADRSLHWHFIGRLQSNKVRLLAPTVTLWHTVDRASLADEIARRAPGAHVLVQLDLAGMPGRGGIDPAEVPVLVAHCTAAGLVVEGLMGVGVPGPPEASRAGFRLLDTMAADLGLRERSMGMSGDLEVAVDEGATIVRIGSALVGPRTSPGGAETANDLH
jgi:PLP dependent protein